VVEAIPGARLQMIGGGDAGCVARCEALVEEMGLRDNVVMRGVLDEQTKFSLMRESRICLFPSFVEGWGIVPQEALACGLPVIVYDLPVYRENIADCEAVFSVAPGDYRAMGEKAVELLRLEDCRRIADGGLEFVSRFSWDEVAAREFRLLGAG
jgi:glycosyltransferase involved in cell wall biosynthesis